MYDNHMDETVEAKWICSGYLEGIGEGAIKLEFPGISCESLGNKSDILDLSDIICQTGNIYS